MPATVIPSPASDGATPAWTSILNCIAPAAAAPPGDTRPTALDARFDVITGHHEWQSTARRCSSQRPAQLPTCATIMAANQYGSMSTTFGHSSRMSRTAGATP